MSDDEEYEYEYDDDEMEQEGAILVVRFDWWGDMAYPRPFHVFGPLWDASRIVDTHTMPTFFFFCVMNMYRLSIYR